MRVRSRRELARQRRPRGHRCWDHLIAAPLWPQHGANLGTLLRRLYTPEDEAEIARYMRLLGGTAEEPGGPPL